MRGFLRKHLSKDLSLLGYPDDRLFWWAHLNYILCYGREDYSQRKIGAQQRHAMWVEKGWTLSLERNWRGRIHVRAVEPPKPSREELLNENQRLREENEKLKATLPL